MRAESGNAYAFRPYITATRGLGYPRSMSRQLIVALALTVLPSCTRSAEDSCALVCENNALCEPGTDEALCLSSCKDLTANDDAYVDALTRRADCIEKNAPYYDDPKGICVALAGGVCNTIQQ